VTEREQQEFEATLRRTRPVKLPEELRSRLLAAAPPKKARSATPWPALAVLGWLRVLRLALPAAAVVAIAAVVVWRNALTSRKGASDGKSSAAIFAAAPLKADDVKIDQELVSSFDTVARLPGGEPVRFRCNQWLDEITLSNKAQGLVLQERTPRLEIVTVGFETY
jgi:membrane-associated protease RseP (regulator of RpoE activity)